MFKEGIASQYLGAKSRTAKRIGAMINEYSERNAITEYIEPFLGSANVAAQVTIPNKYLSEINSDLVAMWHSVLAGTFDPKRITEDEYGLIARNQMVVPAEDRAFYAHAISFGGKHFGGYARDPKGGSDFHQRGLNSIERKRRLLEEHSDTITVTCESYEDVIRRHTKRGVPLVFYCDSPYEGTAGYRGIPKFDHERYWNLMRELSRDHMVFVSEYAYPDDFVPVQSFNSQISLKRENDKPRQPEMLLVHEAQVAGVMSERLS